VSKRHQAHRRKSYGRRRHELVERRIRHEPPGRLEVAAEDVGPMALADRLAFLDPRAPRVRYGLGD
jgi:hypothetical protein